MNYNVLIICLAVVAVSAGVYFTANRVCNSIDFSSLVKQQLNETISYHTQNTEPERLVMYYKLLEVTNNKSSSLVAVTVNQPEVNLLTKTK